MAESMIDDFCSYLLAEKRLSTETAKSYRSDLQSWIQCGLDLTNTKSLSKKDFLKAVERLQKTTWTDSTISRKISALRSLIHYQKIKDSCWENYLDYLPKTKLQEHYPYALNSTQIQTLLNFEENDWRDNRDKAMLVLMYYCGLRVSELLKLKLKNIDEQKQWLVVDGKGSKQRIVPYCDQVEDCFKKLEIEKKERGNIHLFVNAKGNPYSRMAAWKIVRKRGLQAGLENLHPHALRHSIATHLLEQGMDVRFVQVFLGHSTLSTTERYLKISTEALRNVMETYHPLY